MYDRTWNIRKQCEQRGCIAVHAFLGAEEPMVFDPNHCAGDNQSGG